MIELAYWSGLPRPRSPVTSMFRSARSRRERARASPDSPACSTRCAVSDQPDFRELVGEDSRRGGAGARAGGCDAASRRAASCRDPRLAHPSGRADRSSSHLDEAPRRARRRARRGACGRLFGVGRWTGNDSTHYRAAVQMQPTGRSPKRLGPDPARRARALRQLEARAPGGRAAHFPVTATTFSGWRRTASTRPPAAASRSRATRSST